MDGHLFDPDLLQWKVFPADWGCYLRCSHPKEISGFDATERRFAPKLETAETAETMEVVALNMRAQYFYPTSTQANN